MLEFTLNTWPRTNGSMCYNAGVPFTGESLEGVLEVINDIIPAQEADLGLDFVILRFTWALHRYFGERAKGENYAARFATSETTGIERTFLNGTMVRWDQLSDTAVGGFISVACETSSSSVVDETILNVDVYTAKAKNLDIPMTLSLYNSYKGFIQNNPKSIAINRLIRSFRTGCS
ncbi:hypothetical protein F5B21DRAFT_522646 [Xylaria acuta]|nr:hypothetical protein F5B21DRAFT_522646 [Xylaria acuta]